MSVARASLAEPELVLEHISAHGKTVTHLRGTLLASSRLNLRELGVFDKYVQRLPSDQRDAVMYALASSWVPIGLGLTHYRTCEQLELTASQIQRLGELSAKRLIDTFLGRGLKIAMEIGVESYWTLLEQNGRIYDRMYQGGGVTVHRTGPKDMLLENTGQPLVTCHFFRAVYFAYMEAIARAFAKAAFVRPARPRSDSPHAIAIRASWV